MANDLPNTFDSSKNYYRQEIGFLRDHIRSNPDTSILDATRLHLNLRGLKEFGELNGFTRIEHDIAHLAQGLIIDTLHRDGLISEEEYIDYQTGYYSEIIPVNMELGLKPEDQPYPRQVDITPGVVASVQNEENFYRTMGWLIGQRTGDRSANLRYKNGDLEDGETLKGMLKQYGYNIDFKKADILGPVEWMISHADDPKEVYYCTGSHDDVEILLPNGSNGVEDFQPFQFPDFDTRAKIQTMARQFILHMNTRTEELGGRNNDSYDSIRMVEITDILDRTSRAMQERLEAQPDTRWEMTNIKI